LWGDALKNLQDLGLTYTQAKIYLAVLKENPCNFRLISKVSGVARSEVYREIIHLEKAGLVEKTIDRPKIIKAFPMETALRNFVESQKRKVENQISNLESTLIDFVRHNCPRVNRIKNETNSDNAEFILLSQKKSIIAKLTSMLEEAEKEVLMRFMPKKMCTFLNLCSNAINDALEKVNFYIITKKDAYEEGIVRTLKSIIDNKLVNLEIKCLSSIPFGIIIIDGKQILMETAPEDFFSARPMLWTNCQVMLSIMLRDFKQTWIQSHKKIELRQSIQNLQICNF
jgi:sugar-specific transcriptional regulator TrmB